MVEEALASSFRLHSLYTTDEAFSDERAIKVNSKEMEMMTALNSPSSYLAILYKKENKLTEVLDLKSTVIVLDGIADPGNMGTILRTAEWFGITYIFCTDDCVELYNPKTVQSTMGSLFRTTVIEAEAGEIVALLKSKDYRLTGADMHGTSLYDFPFQPKEAIVIGSESHGIRAQMREAMDCYITIPGSGKSESLNASIAASIILSEIYRRR